MAKYKSYDYAQRVMIPISLDDQLMPGTLEFAVHTLVETHMDTSIFDSHYHNDETGRTAYNPKVLLKIILFGYSRGLTTSRKLERACKENVIFMALACGQQPDHSTIAAFVSSMISEILPLFRDVLMVCEESSLLGGTFFALDGCKIPSNASKSMSGRFADLSRNKENLEKKIKQLLKEQLDADQQDSKNDNDKPSGTTNREKQIERLQKKADLIEEWLDENEPKIGKKGREVKSNVTDNDSVLMLTSHGTIQGYNGQAFVDSKHQVIIHGEAFGTGQDHYLVPPMLDGAKENVKAIGLGNDYFKEKTFAADTNYNSPVNLKKCDEEKLDAYIPDKDFRTRDSRFDGRRRKSGRFILDDFKYNEETDTYTCPDGKTLKLQVKFFEVKNIFYRRYATDEENCSVCKLKTRCLTKGRARRRLMSVPVAYAIDNLTKRMAAKIDSDEGRKIYPQRLAVVEPVFANITTHKRMDRFTLRGKVKVDIQWMLYCMVHNIGKIIKYCPEYGVA
ncbi:MAG: IS1182 family transposase [Deltaproteobacteria bacterium]|nr:IS1182 family transposase [Deltaproteobacteria bacterium]